MRTELIILALSGLFGLLVVAILAVFIALCIDKPIAGIAVGSWFIASALAWEYLQNAREDK